MPRVHAAVWVGQITNAERVSAWKSVGDLTRRPLDRADQRRRPELSALSGPQPSISDAPVCERYGIM